MSSLPIAGSIAPLSPAESAACVMACSGEDEQFLRRAFSSFAAAAGSLERSYGLLRGEVTRLRQLLEASNVSLSESLERNRRIRQHLNRVVEGLPCGVIAVAGDGTISLLNPEGRRLLAEMRYAGERAVEPQAVTTGSVQSLSELPGRLQRLLECARLEAGEQEQSFAADSGAVRWLAARHAPVSDDPECTSIFIVRDVSQGKRLEEAREKLHRGQVLAEMSAVLAHEIRNPLGSLELFAGLLGEIDLPQEQRIWVEHVQAGLRNLAATVNNVLHFHSLPEAQRSPTDLGQLLRWAGEFLAPLARQSRVELRLRNGLQGVLLAADRHRLEQVLLNLSLNALRSMPGGGWLELSGRRVRIGEKEDVVIAVADTGAGIATADLKKIFEPGFSTRPGSPGLGLAVCRKIVEQHEGAIEATSRVGAGATFVLRFPLSRAAARVEE